MEDEKKSGETKENAADVEIQKDATIQYPYKTFESTLSFVTKIYNELGHDIYHTREQIAKLNNLSPNTIKQPIGAAQQFGLLEIKHGTGYKTTDLFARINLPTSEEEKRQSVLESLRTSGLYNELIAVYEKSGILPNNTGLSNTLTRQYKFDTALAQRIAREFVTTLKTYDFLDDKNILKINRRGGPINDNSTNTTQATPQREVKPSDNANPDQQSKITITIPLRDKRLASLNIPDDFADADITRISKFVNALKTAVDVPNKE